MVLLHINPSDPFGEFVFPIPTTLGSVGLEILVPKGRTLPPGDPAIVPLNFKLCLPPSHFGLFVLRH